MHRWRRSRKRVMLAAMLAPAVLLPLAVAAAGTVFVSGGWTDWALMLGAYAFWGAFVIGLVCGLTCIADLAVDRRVEQDAARVNWTVALILFPAAAAPAYWWLHVRQRDGEPHGVQTLRPASQWPPRAKALTGTATLVCLALLAAWAAWVVSYFMSGPQDHLAPLAFSALAVVSVVGTALVTLLVLDAARRGTSLWGLLLVVAAPAAVPLYWLLYVRPRAPAGGAP